MSDISSRTRVADDIIDGEGDTERLDREADRILAEAEDPSFKPEGLQPPHARTASLRQAIRDDLGEGRAWLHDCKAQSMEAVRDAPLKTTLYAMGLGVILGLLLRR